MRTSPEQESQELVLYPLPFFSSVDMTESHGPTSCFLGLLRAVDAAADLDTIYSTIVQSACEAFDCERASFYLYDPDTTELTTAASLMLEIDEIRRTIEFGICGFVARRRAIANVPDPSQDARWNAGVDQLTGFHTRNILAAPIESSGDGTLLGVLQLLNKRGDSFRSSDEAMIAAVCPEIAKAIDRTA